MLQQLRSHLCLLCFAIHAPASIVLSADYRIGGVNPEALLRRPNGKDPFPAVVHNHGVGVDTIGDQKAVRRGRVAFMAP